MTTAPQRQPATIEDWLARPEDERWELVRGTLVQKAAPSGAHGAAQLAFGLVLGGPFQSRRGGGPGGWLFMAEADVQLGAEIFRPDICGYRRERLSAPPTVRPIRLVPDWICEILSPANEPHDRVDKLESYFRAGVPHYWILDPVEGTLEIYRRTERAYEVALSARRGKRIRAEPFDAIEITVDELLGDDPPADPR